MFAKYHVRSLRQSVTRDGEYYSIPRTEEQIKGAGLEYASDVPTRFNRKHWEAQQTGRYEYVMKYRRAIKTPYKEGDTVAYLVNENMGTERYTDIVRTVKFGTIVKINPKTLKLDTGKVISFEYVIGKVKKNVPILKRELEL